MKRLFAAILLFICLSVAAFFGLSEFEAELTGTAQKFFGASPTSNMSGLEKLIAKDLRYLEDNHFLGFKKNDVKEIQVMLDSQIQKESELQKIVNLLYSQFPKSAHGKKKLEISLIGGADPNAPTQKTKLLVLQMSLIDLPSQNKIWELGRSYSY